MKRPVALSRMEIDPETNRPTRVEFGVGELVAYSTDFEELRDGVGLFPVGVVELPDGRIESFALPNIRFIDVGTAEELSIPPTSV